ncbi:hypothetical protein TNCV_687601 [Trichonephila clavipes]|nr:hypothetical protein TNCV_687601 [Trichonephila clavipes]
MQTCSRILFCLENPPRGRIILRHGRCPENPSTWVEPATLSTEVANVELRVGVLKLMKSEYVKGLMHIKSVEAQSLPIGVTGKIGVEGFTSSGVVLIP